MTNASLAAVISAAPAGPSLRRHAVRAGDGLRRRVPRPGRQPGHRVGDLVAVDRGEHRAEHGDAERAADLADGVADAEPTPAFSRGSEDMIDSVAGGITLAMPAPWTKVSTISTQIGVAAPTRAKPARPTVTRPRPTAQTAFGPYRLTIAALRGAKISWAAANGVIIRPACSGV